MMKATMEQYGIVCGSIFMDTLLKAYDDLVGGGAPTFQFPSGNIHSLECVECLLLEGAAELWVVWRVQVPVRSLASVNARKVHGTNSFNVCRVFVDFASVVFLCCHELTANYAELQSPVNQLPTRASLHHGFAFCCGCFS